MCWPPLRDCQRPESRRLKRRRSVWPTAKIWYGGGGVSHDVNWLYVDDRLPGSVGDDRDKSAIYEVALLKGRHKIRWEFQGGAFRTNILAVNDPVSGELLPLTSMDQTWTKKRARNSESTSKARRPTGH